MKNIKHSAPATFEEGNSMNKNIKRTRLHTAMKVAMTVASLGLVSAANAVSWKKGDFSASWDTTISYGVSVRVEDRDENLVGKANLNPFVGLLPLPEQIAHPGRFSVNSDDGNLNYDSGELFSNAIKLTTEFGFNYKTWGGFFRGTAFYDFENDPRKELSDTAKEFVGHKARLLDAFLYKDFSIGSHAGTVRVGRQVVSWGESTFIQQGINVINPVDVSKLRVAGAELKEAFLPIDMLYGSLDLTQNLSMEAVYMLEFEQIDPDPAGTYFSTNDFATPGGEYVMLGFGLVPQYSSIPALSQIPGTDPLIATIQNATIFRKHVKGASDSGQYGVAFKYYAAELNDTEFGLYYLRYHSRLPLISAVTLTNTSPSSGAYFIEYPEDINLYGLSFNTNIGDSGISLQGELSYRDNVPLQVDDVELLFAALSPLNPLIPEPALRFTSQLGEYGPGETIRGWERHKMSQLQFTATKLFGPSSWLGTDQAVLLGEIGFTEVWDLPDPEVLRYNGPGTDTGGGPSAVTGGNLRNPVTEPREWFATPFSWGYRLITRLDYNNAFGTPINLFPRLAFNHDVNGITPGPGGNFVEGRKSLTVGVAATYLEKWGADLSYTAFLGSDRHYLLHDRDYVSFNIKYSF